MNVACTFDSGDVSAALPSTDAGEDRLGGDDAPATAGMAARRESLESVLKSMLTGQTYEGPIYCLPESEDVSPLSRTASRRTGACETVIAETEASCLRDSDILKVPMHKWFVPQAAFGEFLATQREVNGTRIEPGLDGLISRELSDDLMEIFGSVYQPWLPFTVPLPPSSRILLLSIYVLAFRHLPASVHQASLFQALMRRFYDCLTSCMLSVCTDVEPIFALLIIYTWAPPPLPGTDDDFRQPWALLHVATRFAGSMKVDYAPDMLRRLKSGSDDSARLSVEDVRCIVEKARLSYQILLEQAAVRRSSPNPTNSNIPFPDLQPSLLVGLPDISDDATWRDTRLIHLYTLLVIVTEGMEVPGPKASCIGEGPGWLNALVLHADRTLRRLDDWDAEYVRVSANVPVSQSFYFRVLRWLYWGHRLVVLSRFVIECGYGDSTDLPMGSIGYLHESRKKYISTWSALSGLAAEAIVRDVVVEEDLLHRLAVVPDCVFDTIMFAAVYFIKSHTWSFECSVADLGYEEVEAMVKRLVRTLECAALQHDHVRKKYAEAIGMFVRSLDERRCCPRRPVQRSMPLWNVYTQDDGGAGWTGGSDEHVIPFSASVEAFPPTSRMENGAPHDLMFSIAKQTEYTGMLEESPDRGVDGSRYKSSQVFLGGHDGMRAVISRALPGVAWALPANATVLGAVTMIYDSNLWVAVEGGRGRGARLVG
ncbi:hypothetical protein DENSPDRAFT_849980 [Dentipellis sp. KUC8613]|nr:hypothetical protein DENSPDRAFT_849980 [Dentipellis sp. KUC8613]